MATWTRKPQETPGKYRFDGTIYLTATVQQKIPQEEITAILKDLHEMVSLHNGLDYLQVYESSTGLTLYIIDQLDDEIKGDHPPEHNVATILFDWEY